MKENIDLNKNLDERIIKHNNVIKDKHKLTNDIKELDKKHTDLKHDYIELKNLLEKQNKQMIECKHRSDEMSDTINQLKDKTDSEEEYLSCEEEVVDPWIERKFREISNNKFDKNGDSIRCLNEIINNLKIITISSQTCKGKKRKMYSCSECKITLMNYKEIIVHMKTKHTAKCNKCHYIFETNDLKNKHQDDIHIYPSYYK